MLKALVLASSLFSVASFAYDLPENTVDMGKVKAQGKAVVLLGRGVETGQAAPDFKVADADFTPVTLADFSNRAVLISVVPSLDTGTCSLQTKHFNEKVASQFPDVAMLTISTDLPFAQKRFCKAENIDKVKTLSDAVWHSFGENYGLLIKDMGLLSRAIFVLDKEHKVVYKQLVENLAKEPNYDDAVSALQAL
ncbi:thiol peroxidase [Pseudoalteromonas peptidolytica]|uniref:Thiol peroxidase, atypical 2-Cys peroxiredoxin n=1 Tax=Pseudoalteromonas peptidolytica F12-50-A1 TaxID=1315280 RepID=A0A8I0MUF8_9GAMM|nr:thiol peroxidase [Pseudoalteromonas peptidolytica]MBE0346085.1 thiol peroxidase, atypical 2-Cys peroxiredoxin [Pseudoalteromonas peptidolytica F12-50-A1]NLR17103.1 thiol peroxidase [Pseudoalteromonas peptidolytica]GEK10358.1 2-Cys peroxiredoxin [Pseudoalteromonas peptidolytica]